MTSRPAPRRPDQRSSEGTIQYIHAATRPISPVTAMVSPRTSARAVDRARWSDTDEGWTNGSCITRLLRQHEVHGIAAHRHGPGGEVGAELARRAAHLVLDL